MSSALLSRSELAQIRKGYDEIATRSHSIDTRCYVDQNCVNREAT
jgi:hypothetical protein